jgi:hypothetical protein
LQYHDIDLEWWGNGMDLFHFFPTNTTEVSYNGVDAKGFTWFEVPEEGFGPAIGEFE